MSVQEQPWSMRRAAVIGAGAMGCALAAVLSKSVPVVLVCRNPDRASQIFRHGLVVEGEIEASARPVIVPDMAGVLAAGGADVIFVATKTTAIDDVANDIVPVLPKLACEGAGPYVVSFQNGIAPAQRLIELLADSRVLRIVLHLAATLDETGRSVHVTLNRPPHAIGSPEANNRSACETVGEVLTQGGLETRYDPDIELAVWNKAIVNAAANPVAALVNCTVEQVMASPARALVESLLDEGIEVARADGLALAADFKERAIQLLGHAGSHLPSMVEDIRRGRESEVGQLNRQIISHAKARDVPVPSHSIVNALIETFDWNVYQRDVNRHG